MKDQTLRFKIFFWIITIAATIIAADTFYFGSWNYSSVTNLIIFGLIAIASESMPVSLPKGGYVTVSYAVFFATVVLFPSQVVLSVAGIAGLFVLGKAALEQPLFKRVFNASQYILSIKGSVFFIAVTNVSTQFLNAKTIVIYVLAAIAFTFINVTTVALALGFMQRKSPWEIWLSNIRWSFLNFAALAPLGLLMALIYKDTGALGLALFVIPLLLSRHSFQRYMDMRENYLNTIKALVHAIEAKDKYTRGHSERVAQYSVAIAEKLQLPQDKVEYILYAAVLHDVGKIGVSESILNKKERLHDNEWNTIRNHPVIGQQLVKDIKFLYDIDLGVRHHHERYDGKGYPDGLKEDKIPLEARIIAVADCFDAMTSDRTYRGSRTANDALKELRRAAGTQFDPQLVEVFCEVYPSINVDESKFLFGTLIEETV